MDGGSLGGAGQGSRTVEMPRVRLSAYHSWLLCLQGMGNKKFSTPPGFPNYIKRTAGILFAHVKQLISF
jgi:hypothetical protein